MSNNLILLILLILLLGCHGETHQNRLDGGMEKAEQEYEMPRSAEVPAPPPPQSSASASSREEAGQAEGERSSTDSVKIGKKIIKDGEMRLEVEDLPAAKQQVDTLLENFQAYYENEQFEAYEYQSTYELKVRVPARNFENLLQAIESGQGKVLSKNIRARDVTEQYLDLSIRLENNRRYLERYNELLARANSVEDILNIQERTRQIEAEIDAQTGRLNYLDDQVKYSTLTLTLIERHEQVAEGRNFGQQVAGAFRDGVGMFLDFLLVLVNLWPFLLLGVFFWAFRKRIGRLFKRERPG